jgi:hypothetical protein
VDQPEAESFSPANPLPEFPADDWPGLKGAKVEIWNGSKLIDRGTVDDVTADGKILWLQQEGAITRRLVEKSTNSPTRIFSVPSTPQD